MLGASAPGYVVAGRKEMMRPGALSLALFALLLTLHPTASGRVYAAYGAVYVAVALGWLRLVDRAALSSRDLLGAVLILSGMGISDLEYRRTLNSNRVHR